MLDDSLQKNKSLESHQLLLLSFNLEYYDSISSDRRQQITSIIITIFVSSAHMAKICFNRHTLR